MGRSIQVFEFEQLTTYHNSRGEYLDPEELDKLYKFNDSNGNKYFTGIRNGVKFKNYVGVIQIGGLTIEILPKADRRDVVSKEDYLPWHNALINMLRECKHISVNAVSEANLKKRHNSILDLYFEMYLDELEMILHKGLTKKYRKHSGNVLALKGRLDFSKNIQKNLIRKERFYTEHQIYDYEHLINQILLKGLTILDNLTFNSGLKDRIMRLKMSFPEIKEIPIQKQHFDRIKINRKTIAYERALQIAKMIILNYAPDIRSGQEQMLTLLFDMNKLWEEYIYRMLIRSGRPGVSVSFQNKQDFWEKRTIRPDLVVKIKEKDEEEKIYVIDTKWKVLDVNNPKPNDNDLKQMFAYNLYWGAERSMLLYPNSERIPESFGKFWKGRDPSEDNQCKVAFTHVLKDNSLDFGIGDYIIDKLLEVD